MKGIDIKPSIVKLAIGGKLTIRALEMILKYSVVAYFGLQSRIFPEAAHEDRQSG